jgi:hypothetical protein
MKGHNKQHKSETVFKQRHARYQTRDFIKERFTTRVNAYQKNTFD